MFLTATSCKQSTQRNKQPVSAEVEITKASHFSRCKRYRYHLSHRWAAGSCCVFVGLNPSTATSEQDDATVRKCAGLAKAWRFSGFELVNLFALRSRDPKALQLDPDPVGPRNNWWLRKTLSPDKVVVVCWGNGGKLHDRDEALRSQLNNAYCLGTTMSGQPKHPLYLSTKTPLQKF